MKSYKCYMTHKECVGNYCRQDVRTYTFELIDERIIAIESGSLGDAIESLKKRYGQDVAWTIVYHKREER